MSKTPVNPNRMQKPAKILMAAVALIFVISQISNSVDTFTLAWQGTNYHAHIDSLAEKSNAGTGRPGFCNEDIYYATVTEDHSSVTFVNCQGPTVGSTVAIVANHDKSFVRLGTVAQYRQKAISATVENVMIVAIATLLYIGWRKQYKHTP